MGFIAFFVLLNIVIAAVTASVKTDRRMRRGEAPGMLYPVIVFAVVFVAAFAAEFLFAYGACALMFAGYHG